jgi:hypothetical protein
MRHDPALTRAATAEIHPIACSCSVCRPLGRTIRAALARAAFGRSDSLEGYVTNVGIRAAVLALALIPGRYVATALGFVL